MRDKIKEFSDEQLIQLATELRGHKGISLPLNSLIGTLLPENGSFALHVIELNCDLVQELADRLANKQN